MYKCSTDECMEITIMSYETASFLGPLLKNSVTWAHSSNPLPQYPLAKHLDASLYVTACRTLHVSLDLVHASVHVRTSLKESLNGL